MNKIIIVIILSSCGPIKEIKCIGESGAELVSESYGEWTCEYFKAADKTAFQGFKNHKTADSRLDNFRLDGWMLGVVHSETFEHDGVTVVGLTYCEYGMIYIGSRSFGRSAITHEYAHAATNCIGREPINPKDPSHSNWDRDMINYTINVINRGE